MATLKPILDTRYVKHDGTYPVKLSISHKGKTSFIGFDISVTKEQWTGSEVSGHPKTRSFNTLIKNKLLQADNIRLNLSSSGKLNKLSVQELRLIIQNNDLDAVVQKEYGIEDHFRKYISNCKSTGTADMYRNTLNKISAFSPGVKFEDINYVWLKSFDTFLSKSCEINTRGIQMRNIRAVFNDAINEDLVSLNAYPFRKFKIKREKKINETLTIDQIKLLRDYPVQPHQQKYRDLFMLIFYLIGINTVDLVHLQHKDYINGRIVYIRAKTGREYSIEVLPEAQVILDRYKGKDYLIDVMDNYTNYRDFSSRFNGNLKKIGKLEWIRNGAKNKAFIKKNKKKVTPLFPNLIIYTARRSWATIASELDISKDTIAASLGHGGNTVTDLYINFDLKKVDAANRQVVALLSK